jgi:NADPH2:quinone reductase
MKAIVFDQFGGPDVLHLADVPIPEPARGEVLIQIAYTAVNPIDWKIREGQLKDAIPHRFPVIPGWDVSGIVTSVGPAVSLFKAGDKVYACARKATAPGGSYADYIALDERLIARMPKNLGFKDAAAIPTAALTAWQALFDHAKLKSGETILIHAGAGGVGSYALQMANNAGAGVITTTSLRNHELARLLGAKLVIDYAREDFVEAARAYVPHGVDIVLDLLGGDIQKKSFGALKAGGRLISTLDIADPTLAASNRVKAEPMSVQPSGTQLSELALQFEDGRLKVPALREYDLRDAAAAQSLIQTAHIQGKIVLKVK